MKIEYLLTHVFMNSPLPFFLSCFSIDFTGQEFVMKATRVQYCQMSVICPSNFWCVWQCDMMSDKNTCSPPLKNRQINRWKTQLFFTDSIQPIDAVVLSSAAAVCESSRVWETKLSRFWSFSFKVCGFFYFYEYDSNFILPNRNPGNK